MTEESKRGVNNMYEEDDKEGTWVCPVCKQEGERVNKVFGKCWTKGCIGVATEGTFREMDVSMKRRAEVVVMDARKGGREGARSYWTDGSGKKVGDTALLKTGWAVVEAEVRKSEGKMEVNRKRSWGGISRNLESVPRCEARAVLSAVQNTADGQVAHIHTDSKITVQQVREVAEMGSGGRRRKYKNKKLILGIIEEVRERGLGLILEWVKGHENMAEEEHNWISKMKMEGNEMADKEAGKAVEEGNEEENFMLEEEVTFRHKGSGVRIGIMGVQQMLKEKSKVERKIRLREPADRGRSENGQGRYMESASKGDH